MTAGEKDYWVSLEFRLCRELAQMKDWSLRNYWCDGFIPWKYYLTGSEPRITGKAWICYGQSQDEWGFTLFLPQSVASQDEIDWASLLPPENATRWLAFDQYSKVIQIEPSAAVSDSDPSS